MHLESGEFLSSAGGSVESTSNSQTQGKQGSEDASGLKTRKPEKLKPRKSKANGGGSHLQLHFLGDWGRRIVRSLRTA